MEVGCLFVWYSGPNKPSVFATMAPFSCGGHGDTFGHYHYHAPPLCLPPARTWQFLTC